MLTVAEKGYGKRTPLAEYRVTSRGGKGVINLKSTDRNGPVVAALQVREDSDVMIITGHGKVIRVHSAKFAKLAARRRACDCCAWRKATASPLPPPSWKKRKPPQRPRTGEEVSHRERLANLLRGKSLVRGEFTLASGKKSDYYLDCRLDHARSRRGAAYWLLRSRIAR